MSKIKDFAHDFLEQSYELDLGYDWDNLPNINDFNAIIEHKVKQEEYFAYDEITERDLSND